LTPVIPSSSPVSSSRLWSVILHPWGVRISAIFFPLSCCFFSVQYLDPYESLVMSSTELYRIFVTVSSGMRLATCAFTSTDLWRVVSFLINIITSSLHLVPRWRMRGAVLPLPQHVFMAWGLVKRRVDFYITCNLYWTVSNLKFSHVQIGIRIAQRYSAGLRVGWSGVRVPVGAGNFHSRVQTFSGAYPASYPTGVRGSFPVGKAAGAWSWPLTSIWCRD
jgi:hypothetical protein